MGRPQPGRNAPMPPAREGARGLRAIATVLITAFLAASLPTVTARAQSPTPGPAQTSKSPSTSTLAAAPAAAPNFAERNAAARRWFEDARLGMFVHWGVYSLLGKGEWVMEHDKLPIDEYVKLPPRFDPVDFDADEWAKLARAAGARYITVTSKHHDGFCMFPSALTDYDVVDATPYRKDPLKALAEACRKHDLKLFFYYSILDWHHPDYFPRGWTGKSAGRPERGDWKRYVAYYQGQVRELCTNYGAIGGIWFDGWWDRPEADWDLEGTYRMIHELQPGALVGNNHHVAPKPGEDFQMFEQDLPGGNTAGFNKAGVALDRPLETCMTLNGSWGYNRRDTHFKSVEELVGALAGAAGRGANLLLNVGPRPDGAIDSGPRERLAALGRWLANHGEAIYGTRRGPVGPAAWGASTARGPLERPKAVYLHVLGPRPGAPIELGPEFAPWSASLFETHGPLKWKKTSKGVALGLTEDAMAPPDTVIVLRPPAR